MATKAAQNAVVQTATSTEPTFFARGVDTSSVSRFQRDTKGTGLVFDGDPSTFTKNESCPKSCPLCRSSFPLGPLFRSRTSNSRGISWYPLLSAPVATEAFARPGDGAVQSQRCRHFGHVSWRFPRSVGTRSCCPQVGQGRFARF